MHDKKWKLAVWGMFLASAIVLSGIIGFFMKMDSSLGALAQGIGLVGAVFGLYSAANVAQKNVISKNYIPEKDGK